MKLLQELAIYKDTFELSKFLMSCIDTFPRLYKHTLGERIIDTALSLFTIISKANQQETQNSKRIEFLNEFLSQFDILMVLIRLSEEKHILTIKQISKIALLTTNIGKQAHSWKGYLQKISCRS